jgi:hypothetical protein
MSHIPLTLSDPRSSVMVYTANGVTMEIPVLGFEVTYKLNDLVPSPLEWLESPEGEAWSKNHHHGHKCIFGSIKDDQGWTMPMHWAPTAVTEAFDDDDCDDSLVYLEEPSIAEDYEIPSCPA